MNLIQIKHDIRRLSLGQLKRFDEWLQGLIRQAEEAKRKEQSSIHKRTFAEKTIDNKTYRLESIRCGKENCKCKHGKLHGPYWYSYSRVKDRVKSRYVGKKLPGEVEKRRNKRD
jgi:hypothetical protein